MLFSFHCPSCKGKLEADASLSGGQADCPKCGGPVAIPEPRVDDGTTLAGFRLERRLGKGGMGEVYLARQLSVDRQVAVKVLPPGFASNPEAVPRFLHEGKLAAKLDHANIVTVFEAGEDNGNFYLAMAYVEGESLDQRLKRDRVLPEAEALGITRAIADALAYAWETFRLLHRDLKPANIMVDRRGRIFLMDLGLAKSLGEESGMTLSGSIIGTPQYMSPEQAQGISDLGVPTDVYSLGATLYHLVTGTPPFTGDTTLKVLHRHLHEPLPPPRSRNPRVSDACSHLIETMMAKEPVARYGDWRALITDIDLVLQGKPPSAQRPGAGASVVMPAPAASAVSVAGMARQAPQALAHQHPSLAPTPGLAPVSATAAKRPPWLSIGIVAAVVVVLALVGALVASQRGPAPAPGRQAVAARPVAPAAVPTTGAQAEPMPPPTPPAPAAQVETTAPAVPTPPPVVQPAPPVIPVDAEPPKAAPTPTEPAAPIPVSDAAALPTESVAPTAPAPAAPADPAQAKLTALVELVAADLTAAKPADALRRWQAGCAAPELKPLDDQVTAIGKTLGVAANIPRHVLDSFKADVGKTVEIELTKEKVTGEIREVTAAGIRVDQTLKPGQGTGKLGRTIALGELSLQERLRHLGTGDTAELNLQRGLLALEAGRSDNARRLFETAGGPLGEALVAQIDAQRADANEAAAEQALSELLRQISGSPKSGDRAKVTAAIRKRCGDDLKRRETARRLLAGFGKAWGRSAAAQTWIPVVQEALAYPPRQNWSVPGLGLELVWVAPGSFQVDAIGGEPAGKPVRTVSLSRGYWMGKYEVFWAEYEAIAGVGGGTQGARSPVWASYIGAMAFCAELTKREQRAGRLPEGYQYRLPTEAEWEYAARGGTKSRGFIYSGSDNLDEVAWYYANSGDKRLDESQLVDATVTNSNNCRTHPVGQKKPNELGLYDMSGNMSELCLDWFDDDYWAKVSGTDPVNLTAATNRVCRGGRYAGSTSECRVASRAGLAPGASGCHWGFRACLAPTIAAE